MSISSKLFIILFIAIISFALTIGWLYLANKKQQPPQSLPNTAVPLTRVLVLDLNTPSDTDYPTFPRKNSSIVIVRISQDTAVARNLIETSDILKFLEQHTITRVTQGDEFYSHFILMFLRRTFLGIKTSYADLKQVGIQALEFDPNYQAQALQLYADPLPHAAGKAIMYDGSKRLIRDILVEIKN